MIETLFVFNFEDEMERLPLELLLQVFEHLNYRDASRLLCSCRSLFERSDEERMKNVMKERTVLWAKAILFGRPIEIQDPSELELEIVLRANFRKIRLPWIDYEADVLRPAFWCMDDLCVVGTTMPVPPWYIGVDFRSGRIWKTALRVDKTGVTKWREENTRHSITRKTRRAAHLYRCAQFHDIEAMFILGESGSLMAIVKISIELLERFPWRGFKTPRLSANNRADRKPLFQALCSQLFLGLERGSVRIARPVAIDGTIVMVVS